MRVIEALREHKWEKVAGRLFPESVIRKQSELRCARCNLVLYIDFFKHNCPSFHHPSFHHPSFHHPSLWYCFHNNYSATGTVIFSPTQTKYSLGPNYVITDIYGAQICISCQIRTIKLALT